MSNKITIESIDAVYQRIPNVTYAQAKEALQVCDGDVVEAIILLESKKGSNSTKKVKKTVEEVLGKDGEQIKYQLKELLRKSSVIRVIIDKDGKTIINIPLTVGVVGLAFATIPAMIGLSAAVIGKYNIKVQNEDDGTTIDLGELTEEKLNMLKDMITNAAKEMKDVVSEKNKDNKDITDELIKETENQKNENKEE
ncbi:MULTISPECIES: DUF4342 domain-containing protein [unclassified Romboutsia]|uniref:DUF4342 domain-containing protein n=1 Tax=unclassified Romboutsia TaxID=2626894 RepID=UPI000821CD13|nr:DUF4342 domain-containing protein [Romboutsia sp. Marseille-P6047]SCH38037.1 Uncharacterised protein [uncultured Clostridium sp.]